MTTQNLYFSAIFGGIQAGRSLAEIAKDMNAKPQNLTPYVNSLVKAGFIKKIGYGTWEILRPLDLEEVKRSKASSTPDPMTTPTPKPGVTFPLLVPRNRDERHVRGHAFVFRLKLPKIPGWNEREAVLKAKGIRYEDRPEQKGQMVWIAGNKALLCQNVVIFYFRSSFFSENANGSHSLAISALKRSIGVLERALGVSFEIGGGHIFKVCRWHFSLVNNSLAIQYNEQGKRLNVRNWKGTWLIIDNSHHLNELETVGPAAMQDSRKVDNWFNGLEELPPLPAFTPQFVLEVIKRSSEDLQVLTQNVAALVEKVKEMER
jgi:hypothetical protein